MKKPLLACFPSFFAPPNTWQQQGADEQNQPDDSCRGDLLLPEKGAEEKGEHHAAQHHEQGVDGNLPHGHDQHAQQQVCDANYIEADRH